MSKEKRIKDFTFGDLYAHLFDCVMVKRLPLGAEPYSGEDHGEAMVHYATCGRDAEFLGKYTTIPTWWDPWTDLYFFGQCFWGTDPIGERCAHALTDAEIQYLKRIGYTD